MSDLTRINHIQASACKSVFRCQAGSTRRTFGELILGSELVMPPRRRLNNIRLELCQASPYKKIRFWEVLADFDELPHQAFTGLVRVRLLVTV
jgi:hypothetical protein